MYIKCIVLDGFKSYAQRTEIQGFDPQFNAITGLNGSGKSNILDSICFVLGITNLTHVRAASLQDLIYKSGQTGVSKATVSITFNNAAKAQAPPGLEQCDEITITRQIMLGGKNKYLINGTIVPNKRIQDVFCSVHLNVNNPHFLVMQGKITKVLNMKPQEILGMIEEAAGTKMYEMKRQVHLKTMERKNTKLKEFQEVFANDIEPRLQKLREQRAQYFEFQRVERDVERLTQICVAWTFYNSERVANVRERDVIAVENKIEELTLAIRENSEAAKLIEREVKDKMEECKLASGGKVEEIEAELRQKQKAAAEAGAAEKAAKESVENEERNIKQLRKALQADEAVLAKKERELSDVRSVFEKLKADEEADGEALVACQKKYEAICAGMEVTESGQAQTLREQLISVSERAKETNTNLEVYNLNLAKCRGELGAKRGGLAGASDNYNRDRSALDGIEREAGAVEASLGQLGYSGERMAELQRRRHALQAAVSDHQDNTENFYASRPHVRFRYADPEPGFDRSSVCGVVATLIKLKDRAYSTAIEMAAGAKLYCVIVDKDTTSKKLLERGNLQNRTTFVPLNQIRSERMTPEVVDFARKLVGKENLVPALDVLEYSPHLQPAMEYVFGNVFLAKDLATAKRVSYHASVKKRCVTLEGDVTDPSGVLSGGARQKATPILMLLKDVQREEEEAKSKQKELALLQSELNSMSAAQEKYSNLKNRLDLLRHQSQILKDRLQQDSFCKQQEEVKQLEATVAELEKNIEEARGVQSDCDSKIRELEAKMTDSKDHLERRQREIEAELAGLQKRAERSREKWVQREGEHRTLNIEMDELRGAVGATEEGIRSAEEAIRALQERHAELQAESDRLKGAVAELRARMQAEEAAIAAKNKEIQQIATVRDRKVQENMKIELEVKRLQHNLTNTQNEYKIAKSELNRCSKDVKSVAEKYLKEAQGLSDGDGHKMQRKLSDGKAKMAELKTKVNPKAQKMYEHEEKEFEQMRKKVEMILKDKEKLIQTIESLDRQKKEAITIAFDRVTEDIGSILGTLLPDAGAKLVIPKGHTILTGVEIKVSLGGVWKDSLGELSGGQRSLVALSLILAMLRFNPAPLYILDEVDAALDLSHTQNIGVMLKQHFKQSQFIIVSLKDGMFNNANVLFKTQFIDGMSTIMRTTNQR